VSEGIQDSAQAGGGAVGRDLGECITRMQLQQVADGFEASDEAARGVALQGEREKCGLGGRK